jgi:PKD repeat protein
MRRTALALLLGCLLLVAGVSAIDGYDYYQTIEYAACDQEIYQQDIVIHRSTGTAYNETSGGLETWHIYVGDHCLEDYGDIRFTNSTGAELAYYLWPDYSSESARFAVRLEGATSAGAVTAHYGNSTATTTSNGGATYWFFDDYSDPATLANYTERYYATWSRLQYKEIANGRLHLGWGGSGYGSALLYADCPLSSGQFRVEAMFQATGSVSYYRQQKEIGLTTPTTPTYVSTGSSAADFSGFGGTVIAMPGDGGQTAPAGSTGHAEYTLGSTTRYPGIWIQDVSSTTLRSEIWIDHILVRTYSAAPPAALTFSGEQEAAAPPITAFTATPAAGLAPLTVQFTDASTGGPTSWSWSFGDGGTSTSQNPQHTYTTPGTYTVTLTATNEYGSDYELKTDYITVYGPITAQFSATPTGGTAPVTVQFTDRSTGGPTSWLWTFGDGGTSSEQNPIHTYTTAGAHTVALTASHPYDSDTETKTAYITVAVLQPFPGLTLIPRDLAGNGLYTDINGNNRLDYNDLTVFFQHLAWAKTAQPTECFDFNGNGWLDYNDVITLFSIITEEHP